MLNPFPRILLTTIKQKNFKKWKNELYSSPKNSLMMLARGLMALIRCQVITKPKSLHLHAGTWLPS